MSNDLDFDLQAAWLRRFSADAESNLRAFALRLKAAMPDLVTVEESKGLFARTAKLTGVTVALGENRYTLRLNAGRLEASVAMVVRGIALSTKPLDPAEWFRRLEQETKAASEQAKSLSRSISDFMAS
jgi:hypothetical protein